MNMFKNVGKAAGTIVDTAKERVSTALAVHDALERVVTGRGGQTETINVVYKNSAKEDQDPKRYIRGGAVSQFTGNALHTAAVAAAEAADTVYVKPVVLAADVAANLVGKERADGFHNAEDALKGAAVGAVDGVIVDTVVMAVSAVERLFGVGGDVQIEETSRAPNCQSSELSSTTTYEYTRLSDDQSSQHNQLITFTYDATYPLTAPRTTPAGIEYRIAIIADLDRLSRSAPGVFVSKLKRGNLTWNPKTRKVSVSWDKDEVVLTSTLNENGRGMELSELNVYNGKLYTVDDKTGIIYEIAGDEIVQFSRLLDGDGSKDKGFKGEWGTVKDGLLHFGGHGTHSVNEKGEITNINNEWVKKVLPTGEVFHVNWHFQFEAVRRAVGISSPGYITHESCCWSDIHQKWFFLPRKINPEAFDDEKDAIACCNILISCDENFQQFEILEVGKLEASHGFASFKFLPGTDDQVIIAIKSKEVGEDVASYVIVFTIDGEILLNEQEISTEKYEGIEFI